MTEATNDDVRQSWDALASYWDEQMEAGNTWQRTLTPRLSSNFSSFEPVNVSWSSRAGTASSPGA